MTALPTNKHVFNTQNMCSFHRQCTVVSNGHFETIRFTDLRAELWNDPFRDFHVWAQWSRKSIFSTITTVVTNDPFQDNHICAQWLRKIFFLDNHMIAQWSPMIYFRTIWAQWPRLIFFETFTCEHGGLEWSISGQFEHSGLECSFSKHSHMSTVVSNVNFLNIHMIAQWSRLIFFRDIHMWAQWSRMIYSRMIWAQWSRMLIFETFTREHSGLERPFSRHSHVRTVASTFLPTQSWRNGLIKFFGSVFFVEPFACNNLATF
jgi:hypothetical protein